MKKAIGLIILIYFISTNCSSQTLSIQHEKERIKSMSFGNFQIRLDPCERLVHTDIDSIPYFRYGNGALILSDVNSLKIVLMESELRLHIKDSIISLDSIKPFRPNNIAEKIVANNLNGTLGLPDSNKIKLYYVGQNLEELAFFYKKTNFNLKLAWDKEYYLKQIIVNDIEGETYEFYFRRGKISYIKLNGHSIKDLSESGYLISFDRKGKWVKSISSYTRKESDAKISGKFETLYTYKRGKRQ